MSRSVLPTAAAFRGARGKARALGRMIVDAAPSRGSLPLLRLPADASVASAQRRTRLAHRTISGAAARDLLAECVARNIAPESAIATALASAAAVDIDTAAVRFAVSASAPFRTHLTVLPDSETTGSYQAMVAVPVACAPGQSLWQSAKEFDTGLRSGIEQRHHLANLGLLGVMAAATRPYPDQIVKMFDDKGPGNLCVSLVDASEFPTQLGAVTLSGAQVISGMSISGYLMLFCTIGRDELALNLGYVDGIISPSRADSLIENTVAALRDAVPALNVVQ